MKIPFRKSRKPAERKQVPRRKDKGPAKRGVLGRVFSEKKRFGIAGSEGKWNMLDFVWGSREGNRISVNPADELHGAIAKELKIRKSDSIEVAMPAVLDRPMGGTANHIIIKVASSQGKGERFFLIKPKTNPVLFNKIIRKYLPVEQVDPPGR